MTITRQDVLHVALLSRLHLDEGEVDKFTTQLNNILEYAGMLGELDISDVPPTSHALPLRNVFREDVVGESLPIEDVLANAPEPNGNFFCVPKIIDEEA